MAAVISMHSAPVRAVRVSTRSRNQSVTVRAITSPVQPVAPVAGPNDIQQAAPRAAIVPAAAVAILADASPAVNPAQLDALQLELERQLALPAATPAVGDLAAAPSQLAQRAAPAAQRVVADLLLAPYRGYAHALETRPLLTKALTSCVGFMLGDVLAQHFAHSGAALDMVRVLRLGAYGLCLDGPLGSLWYDWLEGAVFPDRPTDTKAVLAKTALDQVVYASIGTAMFFAVITAMEGHPEAVGSVVAAKFWPTLAANWGIWPLAHLINFKWVPSNMRIAYNNVVAIGWLALLSMITHSQGPPLLNAVFSHLQAGHCH